MHDITDEELKDRVAFRYRVLRCVFNMTTGHIQKTIDYNTVVNEFAEHGNVHQALLYLRNERLIEVRGNEYIELTHAGVVEYERSRGVVPGELVHFTRDVTMYVNTTHVSGSNNVLGAIQTGGAENSTAVAQGGGSDRGR